MPTSRGLNRTQLAGFKPPRRIRFPIQNNKHIAPAVIKFLDPPLGIYRALRVIYQIRVLEGDLLAPGERLARDF